MRSAAVLLVVLGACRPSTGTSRAANARELTAREQRMVRLLDHLELVFAERYAPTEYKAEVIGWNFATELHAVRAGLRAEGDTSVADFRWSLKQLFRGARDGHTGILLEGERAVWLGLHFRKTPSGLHLAWIDRSVLPRETFPFEPGAELLEFEGMSSDDAVSLVVRETGAWSTPGLTSRFAELFLGLRSTTDWREIPRPKDTATLRMRARDGSVSRVELPWRDVDEEPPSERPPFWGKTRHGYVPALGVVTWRAPDDHALPCYVFEARGKSFGYVRAFTYAYDGTEARDAIADFDVCVASFAEREVEGLVFDHTGNGGGNFLVGFEMLSRLIDRPLKVPTQNYQLDHSGRVVGFWTQQEFASLAASLGDEPLNEHPLFAGPLAFAPRTPTMVAGVRSWLEFFVELEPPENGRALTPLHYSVFPEIRPRDDEPRYAGPILVLIDELTLSAPEFVVSTLVDNGRAVAFGATTAGAGGDRRSVTRAEVCVAGEPPPAFTACVPEAVARAMAEFGVLSFGYTVTLGMRVDGRGQHLGRIENRGVEPSVAYEITAGDLRGGFGELRGAVLDALDELAPRG